MKCINVTIFFTDPKRTNWKNPNYPTANNKKYKVFNEEPNMWVVTAYFVEPCKSYLFIYEDVSKIQPSPIAHEFFSFITVHPRKCNRS